MPITIKHNCWYACLLWCGCLMEEEQLEPKDKEQLERIEARKYDIELSKKYRKMRMPNYSAQEAAGKFSCKLKKNRAPKIKETIVNTLEDSVAYIE